MDKIETVALMAAIIHAARPAGQREPARGERIAEEAWVLYDAVEKESAERHSRR
jgi:hypothetical protein